jgi:hypothetical protein
MSVGKKDPFWNGESTLIQHFLFKKDNFLVHHIVRLEEVFIFGKKNKINGKAYFYVSLFI